MKEEMAVIFLILTTLHTQGPKPTNKKDEKLTKLRNKSLAPALDFF